FTRTAGESDCRVDGDVVALRRAGTRAVPLFLDADHRRDDLRQLRPKRCAVLCSRRTRAAAACDHGVEQLSYELVRQHKLLTHHLGDEGAARLRSLDLADVIRRQAVRRWRDEALEDAWRADDRGELRVPQWNADHLDTDQRGVRILARWRGDAPGQLLLRAHLRRARHVDVDVLRVAGVLEHGVRVRSAARLDVADIARIADVRDVEDADAAQTVMAHRLGHALRPAVQPSAQALTGYEQQVAVDRHVALRRGADVADLEPRVCRIGDVPDLEPVVVALDHVIAREGEVRVRHADEVVRRRRGCDLAQVPDRLLRIEEPRTQPHPGIR